MSLTREQTLARLGHRLDELAVVPAVVARLSVLDPNAADFPSAVLELTAADPPLALRLIRAANRAAVAARHPIESIPAAVAQIGARETASLITALSVVEVFVPRSVGQRNLWIHAIQVAVTARTIAQVRPDLEVDPEHAYLAGLLHDVGRFVMFAKTPAELGEVDESRYACGDELRTAELAICGIDHAELGWHACRHWALPDRVAMLIRDHHVYDLARHDKTPPELRPLVRVVQEADVLSFLMLIDPALAARPTEELRWMIGARLAEVGAREPPVGADTLASRLPSIDRTARELVDLVLPPPAPQV